MIMGSNNNKICSVTDDETLHVFSTIKRVNERKIIET